MIHDVQTLPWARLAAWFTLRRANIRPPLLPLTLVTMTVVDKVTQDEIEFYGDAEIAALTQWAHRGAFILALAAVSRAELTLLCPAGEQSTTIAVEELPMVSAGIAQFDIRGVLPFGASATIDRSQPM